MVIGTIAAGQWKNHDDTSQAAGATTPTAVDDALPASVPLLPGPDDHAVAATDINESRASAEVGRAKKYPWYESQSRATTSSNWLSDSIPSATTVISRLWASLTMALTISLLVGSRPRSATKAWSILTMLTGNCLR